MSEPAASTQQDTDRELPPASRRWQGLLLTLMFALVVSGVSLWQNFDQLPRSSFHPDESRWLNRAWYLSEVANPTSDVWAESYLIRGQPPMGSYVTGLGLWLQGRDLDTNGPWNFQYGFEKNIAWNVTYDKMPAQQDLEAARQATAVIGAGSTMFLFALITLFTNRIGGLVGGLMFAFHPLQTYLSTLATADTLFTFLVALSALAAGWLARRPSWWRALMLALALGAGASTKLSPLFIPLPLAVLGVLLIADNWLRGLPAIGTVWSWLNRGQPGAQRRLGWMLVVQPVLVGVLFVLSYPYLWSAPLGRTQEMLNFRRDEMENQAGFWPKAAIDSPFEAVQRTWTRLTIYSSTTGRFREWLGVKLGFNWESTGFELPFALAGLVILVYLCWKRGLGSPTALATGVLLTQGAIIMVGLGVDFDRYYLPIVLVVCTGLGVLAGTVWRVAVRWITGRSRHAYSLSLAQPNASPGNAAGVISSQSDGSR